MKHTHSRAIRLVSVAAVAAIALGACGSSKKAATGSASTAAAAAGGKKIGVALVLKTLSNPFFISMQKSAEKHAAEVGVELKVSAGTKDGDDATQIAAIENAVSAGYKGILITPSTDAVVPAITKARAAGLLVIALDTPPNPASSVDITYATDNRAAGKLIGQWTAGKLAGKKAVIAMLDLFNDKVVSVDTDRDQGFLEGMGIAIPDKTKNGSEAATGKYTGGKGGDYSVVCHEQTNGATPDGKTAMETCLSKSKDINVVYTINEPAAVGAADALKAAGVSGALIVSVDGGCKPGLEAVQSKIIGATSQQYPGDMASKGIDAIVTLAKGGAKPAVSPGLTFFNTGVKLVTDDKVAGVDSISVADGLKTCWG